MRNILIAALWMVSVPAFADSNCNQPKDDFDGLYCLNKVYIQADKDLNENYGKLMSKLDPAGKTLLKQGQLSWIDNRNQRCSYRNEKGFFVNLGCATSTTIARTKFLSDRYRECISAGCFNNKLQSSLRYDGVYRSPAPTTEDDQKNLTYWKYLRFYPDGEVIATSSTGSPDDLRKWFSKDKKDNYYSSGSYSLKGDHVSFSATSNEGTVDYSGTLEGNRLKLETYSHINGYSGKSEYVFFEW